MKRSSKTGHGITTMFLPTVSYIVTCNYMPQLHVATCRYLH